MDLKHLIGFDELQKRASEGTVKRVFFYRIAGTGMGAAACLLKEKGFDVEGADGRFDPPMGPYLKQTGIKCHHLEGFDLNIIKQFDLLIIGNVVPGKSTEARELEQLGVAFCSFPQALGALILSAENVVGIAGTHGKTTTTYFMTQIFEKLGMKPGYFIGGVVNGKPSSMLGDKSYFFIEADEYDSAYFEKISKFRKYCIDHIIITSLEFDHADIFNSLDDIKLQFKEMLKYVRGTGIFNSDYPTLQELSEEFSEQILISKYGERTGVIPRIIKLDKTGTEFELILNGLPENFKTSIVGMHNILNLTSCILFAYQQTKKLDEIKKAVEELELVKRRQELRGIYKGAVVIDDFAHHPRAVTSTIEAVQSKYPERQINVIWEPHSATARSNIFQEEFFTALKQAKQVVITSLARSTSIQSAKDLDIELIVENLKSSGVNSTKSQCLKDLRHSIESMKGEDQVILVLSNGTCLGLWDSDFINEIL